MKPVGINDCPSENKKGLFIQSLLQPGRQPPSLMFGRKQAGGEW